MSRRSRRERRRSARLDRARSRQRALEDLDRKILEAKKEKPGSKVLFALYREVEELGATSVLADEVRDVARAILRAAAHEWRLSEGREKGFIPPLPDKTRRRSL